MSLLFESPEAKAMTEPHVYYRCEPTDDVGLDSNGNIITGFTLKPYAISGHDFVEGEVEAAGQDVKLSILGDLVTGAIYRAGITDIVYDCETGQADDWSVTLARVDNDDELAEVERIRQAAESAEQSDVGADSTSN